MFTRMKERNNKNIKDNTTTATTTQQQENQENHTTTNNKMNYKPGQETTTDVKKQ